MREVETIYANIANGINANINASWEQAWIKATVFDDACGVDGEYISSETGDVSYFIVEDQAFDDFEELHSLMTENGKPAWNRAKFTLYPTGKFSIDFEWDQALADEVEANS